ncbi:MAG TPA: MOSC domain-containing protein [Roseiflexaceae bacterium]|nr:MOSC domain-containing protein [Roseiflexaceae bacterium]
MNHDQPTSGAPAAWRMLRVQAGKLQDIPFADGVWTTAIYKMALDGSVVIEHNGIVGDEHTGSGPDPERALCCCPADHYTHWRAALGIELPLGIFGENLTLAGVTEHTACIGDTLRCGSTLLQVSQPRMPCYKQARRIGQPDFVKQIMESGRLGFLLRVLTPGSFQPDDALTLVDRPHPDVPVAAVVRAFCAPEDLAAARQLADLALLAPEWRKEFARRVA